MRLTHVLPFVIIAFSVASCLNDKGDSTITVPCDTTSYYHVTIKPLIETHCTGNSSNCHIAGGAGNGDFTKYSVLKEKIETGIFQQRVFILKDMPPDPTELDTLSDSERTILEDWVNSGYEGCD
jgi:hypothetical protein